MSQRIDHLKDRLLDQLAARAESHRTPPGPEIAARFIRAFYANVAPEDLLRREAEDLYGAAMALFDFLRVRLPGQAHLRITQPDADTDGWRSEHSVIEIANDDMPFLVDSLTNALHAQDIAIHLLVHPILTLSRRPDGTLSGLGDGPGAIRESVMHIEIDRRHGQAECDALAASLLAVLAEVRAVVEDWPAMRASLQAVIAEMGDRPAGLPPGQLAEFRDFLRWIHDDNFTFLGYRAFRFDAAPGASGKGRSRPDIEVVAGSGQGLLRDPGFRIFHADRDLAATAPDVRAFLKRPDLLLLTKADRSSRVHRDVMMDIVGVKQFDAEGRVVGMHGFLGLFTAAAYTQSPLMIPLLREKIGTVLEMAGFPPASHDARALQAILENHPRDELLQASEASLHQTALGILHLQERPRAAVFLRQDEFGRFVSALVYLPRDRYDTGLRLAIQALLEEMVGGQVSAWYAQVGDSPLARLHFIVKTANGKPGAVDLAGLDRRLADLARSWADRLQEALVQRYGEDVGLTLFRRWGPAFPAVYRESTLPSSAVEDIVSLEVMQDGLSLCLYQRTGALPEEVHFKIYRKDEAVALSDVLPIFENLGFRVLSEVPFVLAIAKETRVWVHDFTMRRLEGAPIDPAPMRKLFESAFRAVWQGEAEEDGFNRLVIGASLHWRQVSVLRAYARYLRQAGSSYSQAYIARCLAGNPEVAALLVRLFETRFDPDGREPSEPVEAELAAALDRVVNADEDRILRRLGNLIASTLRTNYFQTGPDGRPKDYLSFKLDSRKIDNLPLPRPMVEIFVISPGMEGIHLRGGKVARGGIRWSDRPEDFRTEILGLMKAQMVKNSVIVPVGSKGGFVVKRPAAPGLRKAPPSSREAIQEEGIACYKTLMRGLLDLTDNLAGGQVVPPPRLVRRDEDDPYLVVAADKGTASFSDIANGVSGDYGFWLGDAFASGGSQGYDHKAMGITARGAWESVKRHFRELGQDIQAQDFTVIGVGDMSGDVFGNGMLRSPHIRLIAAFDHRHIFLDPDPDPASAFAERQRLFALPRSSWADYDPARLSKGGGIYPRDAKSLSLSAAARSCYAIETDSLTPAELIRHLLKARVDLLWFGGIGTYIKARSESHAEVGDRANEAVRIDAADLRCKVVGEGANLAVTQKGRIEAGLGGVRINSDAIDNSAGVDTSDHEVNIKILVDAAVRDGVLDPAARNELLASMTEEVGHLVLRDNYLQTQAISNFESQAALLLDQQERFMRLLERAGRLDRQIESLPDDEEIARRAHAGIGLTRPEIGVLLAYGKLWVYDAILDSDLPDDPLLFEDLKRYFPKALDSPDWQERMKSHRLAREIIATQVTNSMINRIGGSFVARIMERTGTPPSEIAKAYIVVRDAYGLRAVWDEIERLDNKVPAAMQANLHLEANRLIERAMGWVLAYAPRPLNIGLLRAELEPGIATLREQLARILPGEAAAALAARAADYQAAGVPKDLAERVASLIVLASANDIGRVAGRSGRTIADVARIYFMIASRFGMGWLRAAAERLPSGNHWQKLAVDAVIDDLYARQTALAASVAAMPLAPPASVALARWIEARKASVERADQLLGELKTQGKIDLATLVVATHQFRGLTEV